MSATNSGRIRRQHHVWRHYLEAWTAGDGRLFCLHDEKIFLLNPRNAAVEKDFYKLQELEKIDLIFLERLIDDSPPPSRKSLRDLVSKFTIWHKSEKTVLISESENKERALEHIRTQINNYEENYHAVIERRAIPIISELRRGISTCLSRQENYINFANFLSAQWFRTKGLQTRIKAHPQATEVLDTSKSWHIQRHIFPRNLGATIFVTRLKTPIRLIKNRTTVPFITGDQPVINLFENRKLDTPPTSFALYYPVSPTYAIYIDDLSSPLELREDADEELVSWLNQKIAVTGHAKIFGNTQDVLRTALIQRAER